MCINYQNLYFSKIKPNQVKINVKLSRAHD